MAKKAFEQYEIGLYATTYDTVPVYVKVSISRLSSPYSSDCWPARGETPVGKDAYAQKYNLSYSLSVSEEIMNYCMTT